MCFGRQGNSTVQLDLGDTAWKEAVSVAFRLRQTDASRASYLFHVGLEDTDRDKGYSIACSPARRILRDERLLRRKDGRRERGALRGDADWQQMALRFDPAGDRLVLTQDGKPVWQGTNALRLPRVNRLVFSSGGTVRWRVDDVRIDVVRNDPAAKPDPGTAQSRPFTATACRILTRTAGPFRDSIPGDRSFRSGSGASRWARSGDQLRLADPRRCRIQHRLAVVSRPRADARRGGQAPSSVGPGRRDRFGPAPGIQERSEPLGNVWHDEPTGSFWGKDMQAKFDAFVAYRRQVRTSRPGPARVHQRRAMDHAAGHGVVDPLEHGGRRGMSRQLPDQAQRPRRFGRRDRPAACPGGPVERPEEAGVADRRARSSSRARALSRSAFLRRPNCGPACMPA